MPHPETMNGFSFLRSDHAWYHSRYECVFVVGSQETSWIKDLRVGPIARVIVYDVLGFGRAEADDLYSRTPGGSMNIIVPFLITKVVWGIASVSGSVGTLASFVVFSKVAVSGISVDAEEGHLEFAGESLGRLLGDSILGDFITLLAWTVILTSWEAIFGII
jgi:hypothetical protein